MPAIPIHNERGELVAYAGRYAGDPLPDERKYKLPPKFRKQLVLFNLHRAKHHAPAYGLIVVEGFFGVFALWQAGFRNAVALMGTSLSQEQERLLLETVGPSGRITLMLGADAAGRKGATDMVRRLVEKAYVKDGRLSEEQGQPDRLTPERLEELLGA